jgi:GDP-L-fucose synthase
MAMSLKSKIYVAGHHGLVGSAIMRRLKAAGYQQIVTRTHQELELTDNDAVARFFKEEQPEFVLLAAAKVGGILANNNYPAEFIQQNLAIQTNVIHEAWKCGTQRLLFLGSSCIYPRDCPQPMKEEHLLTGTLEGTNRPYAIAKISGIEMCWAYNRQYETQFLSVMPTNLFGPGDNYDLQTSHVLPALIRKMHDARVRGEPKVVVWGTGTPLREFLFCDDMADACVYLMELPEQKFLPLVRQKDFAPLMNIGVGKDITICGLAELVKEVVGYDGALEWDTGKPDGTPRKLMAVERLTALGWTASTTLREGIEKTYADFLENQT